jgi:hypothetical protein
MPVVVQDPLEAAVQTPIVVMAAVEKKQFRVPSEGAVLSTMYP